MQAVPFEKGCSKPEEIQHQAMIGQGLLNGTPVRQNLVTTLLIEQRDAGVEPFPANCGFPEYHPHRHETDALSHRVVPERRMQGKPLVDQPGLCIDALEDLLSFRG